VSCRASLLSMASASPSVSNLTLAYGNPYPNVRGALGTSGRVRLLEVCSTALVKQQALSVRSTSGLVDGSGGPQQPHASTVGTRA